jgi:hypothetical protein
VVAGFARLKDPLYFTCKQQILRCAQDDTLRDCEIAREYSARGVMDVTIHTFPECQGTG